MALTFILSKTEGVASVEPSSTTTISASLNSLNLVITFSSVGASLYTGNIMANFISAQLSGQEFDNGQKNPKDRVHTQDRRLLNFILEDWEYHFPGKVFL